MPSLEVTVTTLVTTLVTLSACSHKIWPVTLISKLDPNSVKMNH